MAAKVHLYRVEMTCEGCANSISNVLKKNKDKGIDSFDVNLKDKTVAVRSTLDANAIMEIIKKTGKPVSYLGEKKQYGRP